MYFNIFINHKKDYSVVKTFKAGQLAFLFAPPQRRAAFLKKRGLSAHSAQHPHSVLAIKIIAVTNVLS
jgi:hypothetical protein